MICPHCHGDGEPRQLGFTWWGGVIGPKLLHHVECPRCLRGFNGRTGRSNTAAIAIYMAVVCAVGLALVFAITRA